MNRTCVSPTYLHCLKYRLCNPQMATGCHQVVLVLAENRVSWGKTTTYFIWWPPNHLTCYEASGQSQAAVARVQKPQPLHQLADTLTFKLFFCTQELPTYSAHFFCKSYILIHHIYNGLYSTKDRKSAYQLSSVLVKVHVENFPHFSPIKQSPLRMSKVSRYLREWIIIITMTINNGNWNDWL